MSAIRVCRFKLVDHPYYSPDLVSSDCYLLPNMKKILSRKRYQSDDEVTSAVEDYFEGQKETVLKTGIQMLKHHWKKCEGPQRMYKNNSCRVMFDYYIIVGLRTFQPHLVQMYSCTYEGHW